jgi:hypothetical protein
VDLAGKIAECSRVLPCRSLADRDVPVAKDRSHSQFARLHVSRSGVCLVTWAITTKQDPPRGVLLAVIAAGAAIYEFRQAAGTQGGGTPTGGWLLVEPRRSRDA